MKKEIKERTKNIEIKELYVKCLRCQKEIRGRSEGQVLQNLKVHRDTKACKENQK